nr:Atu4866 domain-containing protein [Aeromicrobium camelliae]
MPPRNEPDQAPPLVVADATIHVSSSRPERTDMWVQDGVITHVGRSREDGPTGSRVVEAHGASIVPLVVGSAARHGRGVRPSTNELVAGSPATFAITRSRIGPRAFETWMIIRPTDLVAVVVAGHVMAWRGEPTAACDPEAPSWCGTWVDDARALEQHLLPGGRYTETPPWSGRRLHRALTGRAGSASSLSTTAVSGPSGNVSTACSTTRTSS